MEIAEGAYSIGQRKGGRVHAFMFEHGGELTLVDTLFDADAHVVLEYIRRLGHSPRALARIVLTHAHRSHLGGLATLKRLTGATVYAHEWEADIIAGERRAQPVTLLQLRPLAVIPFRIGLAVGKPEHAPCPVDEVVRDDDALGPVRVLHIPGHSPGHLGFHWPERGVLVTGDAVATWPMLCPGWPAFNLNEAQHRMSLRRLAELDARVVGVGHGEPITERASEQLDAFAESLPPGDGTDRKEQGE